MNKEQEITSGTKPSIENNFSLDQGSKELFKEAQILIMDTPFFSEGSEDNQDLSSSAEWNEIEDIIAI